MENEIREVFVKAMKNEIDVLSTLQPGSKERSEAIDGVAKLYKIHIDEIKQEREFMERCDRDIDREREWKIKNAQLDGQKWDRYVTLGLGVATIIAAPIINYRCNMRFAEKICTFELTDSFRSSAGRAMSRGVFKFLK